MNYKILLGSLLVLPWLGCEREVEDPLAVDYSYFPIETGRVIEYEVDSILYSDFTMTVDTVRQYLREEIRGEMLDNEGDTVHQVYRSYRSDTTQEWGAPRVWTVKREDYQIQKVEENMRFIRMVFPVREDKEWDGVVYVRADTVIPFNDRTQETINIFKDWDKFSYSNVDEPMTINGFDFPETVTLLHVDKTNNIERRYSMEIYAKNIGLVYKEMWILDTQCGGDIAGCLGDPWEEKAEKGFILRQRVRRYE